MINNPTELRSHNLHPELSHAPPVQFQICLGKRQMSTDQAARLEPGNVIELDGAADDDVQIFVDGRLFAEGQPVVVKSQEHDRLAVAVNRVLPRLNMIALLVAMLLSLSSAFAQTIPASNPVLSEQPIYSQTDDRVVGSGDEQNSSDWRQTSQTLFALAIVVALIFVFRFVLRRIGNVSGSAANSEVMEVLARTTVAPRQQLLLVRLGSRLVLVGSWRDGMSALANINDPAEVAAVTEAAQHTATNSLKNLFKPVNRLRAGQADPQQTAAGELAKKIRQRLDKDPT